MNNLQQDFREPFVDVVYEIVKMETQGLDSVYEDYIIGRVGALGLNALKESNLIETCGVVNGRQLYVLVEK